MKLKLYICSILPILFTTSFQDSCLYDPAKTTITYWNVNKEIRIDFFSPFKNQASKKEQTPFSASNQKLRTAPLLNLASDKQFSKTETVIIVAMEDSRVTIKKEISTNIQETNTRIKNSFYVSPSRILAGWNTIYLHTDKDFKLRVKDVSNETWNVVDAINFTENKRTRKRVKVKAEDMHAIFQCYSDRKEFKIMRKLRAKIPILTYTEFFELTLVFHENGIKHVAFKIQKDFVIFCATKEQIYLVSRECADQIDFVKDKELLLKFSVKYFLPEKLLMYKSTFVTELEILNVDKAHFSIFTKNSTSGNSIDKFRQPEFEYKECVTVTLSTVTWLGIAVSVFGLFAIAMAVITITRNKKSLKKRRTSKNEFSYRKCAKSIDKNPCQDEEKEIYEITNTLYVPFEQNSKENGNIPVFTDKHPTDTSATWIFNHEKHSRNIPEIPKCEKSPKSIPDIPSRIKYSTNIPDIPSRGKINPIRAIALPDKTNLINNNSVRNKNPTLIISDKKTDEKSIKDDESDCEDIYEMYESENTTESPKEIEEDTYESYYEIKS